MSAHIANAPAEGITAASTATQGVASADAAAMGPAMAKDVKVIEFYGRQPRRVNVDDLYNMVEELHLNTQQEDHNGWDCATCEALYEDCHVRRMVLRSIAGAAKHLLADYTRSSPRDVATLAAGLERIHSRIQQLRVTEVRRRQPEPEPESQPEEGESDEEEEDVPESDEEGESDEEEAPVWCPSRLKVTELTDDSPSVQEKEDSCCVCLEEYVAGEQVAQLPCQHILHHNCAKRWLNTRASCPMCRRAVL